MRCIDHKIQAVYFLPRAVAFSAAARMQRAIAPRTPESSSDIRPAIVVPPGAASQGGQMSDRGLEKEEGGG